MQKNVLFVFGHGVEELELIAPADLLRRAGLAVSFASTEETRLVNTRGGFVIQCDRSFSETDAADVDLLVLPGGPGVMALRQRQDLLGFLREYGQSGKPLAAICAAPLLLQDAGLLEGKQFTCHDSCWTELARAHPSEKVVIDGALITSQGAGTALDFGLVLVERMCGEEVRAQIARAIMV
jgi:4-methyl-5(b-hydroxyethyl)-thiazole monophosphate biosynthesis